jgi:putative membrane protein
MLALVNEAEPGAPDEVQPRDPDGADRRTALAGERTDLADRRTSLAGERTLLAWWRTGLTSIAVALGVGRLLPELAHHSTRWPYAALGVGFALYGIAMFMLGTRRMGVFDRSTWKSEPHSGEDRALVTFMGVGVILGLGTLVLIVTQ